jgi:MFS family permease
VTGRVPVLEAPLRSLGGGLGGRFWRLWWSAASANLADGITGIVFPLLAVRLTSSPAEIAGLAVAHALPQLAFGLLAGGLADRLDRRVTMLTVQVVRVGVIGAMLALAVLDALSLPILYAAALATGAGEAFFDTNAQSMLPAVVARRQLQAANGRLFAAEILMNTFLGPPLGGFLIALSVPVALGSGVAGFALAAAGLFLLGGRSYRAERSGERRPLHVEIGEGIGYLARHRLLLTLSGMVALGRAGSGAVFAVFVLYAVAPGPMGLSEPEFGILFTTFGIGSLIGSFAVARAVAAVGRANLLALVTLVFALGLLVPVFTADAWVIGAGFFVSGIAGMMWNVTNVSLRQSLLPSRLMGRVHATHRFVAIAAGLLGAAAGGAVGEAIGLRAVFAIGAAIVGVGIVGRLIVTEARIEAAERAAGPA